MDRRKVIEEAISTLQLTEELDWDKLLWLPGEKKIFVPTLKQVSFYEGFDFGSKPETIYLITEEMWKQAVNQVLGEARNLVAARREQAERCAGVERCEDIDWCDCSDRGRWLGITRDVPITYNDIRRSEVPQFRGGDRRRLTNYW